MYKVITDHSKNDNFDKEQWQDAWEEMYEKVTRHYANKIKQYAEAWQKTPAGLAFSQQATKCRDSRATRPRMGIDLTVWNDLSGIEWGLKQLADFFDPLIEFAETAELSRTVLFFCLIDTDICRPPMERTLRDLGFCSTWKHTTVLKPGGGMSVSESPPALSFTNGSSLSTVSAPLESKPPLQTTPLWNDCVRACQHPKPRVQSNILLSGLDLFHLTKWRETSRKTMDPARSRQSFN